MASPQLKQKNRLLELRTPLEKDAVVVNGFSGSEAISGLYRFKLELLANSEMTDVMGLLGKPVGVSMQTDGDPRHFHGIVSRIATGPREKGFWHYSADVVPWLWLLTQRAGCRIFQDKSIPDIITAIFNEYNNGYSDVVSYDNSTTPANHIPLDYCVQYRETDFNFVSRLMEQEGIYYYFDHSENGHKLVFTDTDTFLDEIDGKSTVLYQAEQGYGEREDVVTHWSREYAIRPRKYLLRDHHFELPGKNLEVSEGREGLLEIYDYPGEYAARFNQPEKRIAEVNDEGEKLVKVRLQEEELPGVVFEGTSNCRNFSIARTFNLDARNLSSFVFADKQTAINLVMMNQFILTSVTFSAAQNPDYISNTDLASTPYHNSFACVRTRDQSLPGAAIRPRRLTPKPVVAGPQTAIVTVKSGEESWLDKYGRVRVKFHWDREKESDENSACWVRVAQPWAGGSWGAHFWPRVGQEVVVEFLEGDPDQPIITGSVYNAATMPPYELPANYTRSGIITRSSKNGGSKNFNELRFEDKKDSEQIFINAEKDMDERVEHDMREFIGNNQHLIVKAQQTQKIGAGKHEHVAAEHIEKVDGDASRVVGGEHMEKIGKDLSITVVGEQKEKIGTKLSVQIGQEHHEKVGQLYALESGQEIHLKSGMKIIIESGLQISLKGPGGFVDIGPAGVTIQGTMVLINSGGSAGSGSGASPSDPKDPSAPKDPQIADDGSKGGALG